MANRVMQQKRLKMARMRRAYARTFRRSNGGSPNREVIKEYQLRARGLAFGNVEDVCDALLPGKMEIADKQNKLNQLHKQALLEAMMPIDCDMHVRGPTEPDIFQESLIYFNARKTKFVLVLRDLEQHIERVSYVFSSKELLITCWEMDRVNWAGNRAIVR